MTRKFAAIRVYLSVFVAVVVILGIAVIWMPSLHKATEEFKIPKIVGMHLEGEPFVRIKLAPGWHLRPIDVIYGSNALVTCEVVKAPMGQKYEAFMFGHTQKAKDCRFHFKVTDSPGVEGKVTVTYRFKTKEGWGKDSFTVPYRVIPAGQFIRIYTMEDANHKPVTGPYCKTRQVYVYGTAALPYAKDGLVPLFFVDDPLNPGPVLQVSVDKNERLQPVQGKVVEFRRYGDKLHGLAFWSLQPINVGPEDANKGVFNIYAGLFKEQDVPRVVNMCLKIIQSSTGHISIQSRIHNIEDVRSAARALTKSWQVIRSSPMLIHPDLVE